MFLSVSALIFGQSFTQLEATAQVFRQKLIKAEGRRQHRSEVSQNLSLTWKRGRSEGLKSLGEQPHQSTMCLY